jgi:hypothetical protein
MTRINDDSLVKPWSIHLASSSSLITPPPHKSTKGEDRAPLFLPVEAIVHWFPLQNHKRTYLRVAQNAGDGTDNHLEPLPLQCRSGDALSSCKLFRNQD